jgi:hypothetical protein
MLTNPIRKNRRVNLATRRTPLKESFTKHHVVADQAAKCRGTLEGLLELLYLHHCRTYAPVPNWNSFLDGIYHFLLIEYLELPGTLWLELGIYFLLFVCQSFQKWCSVPYVLRPKKSLQLSFVADVIILFYGRRVYVRYR